MYVCLLADVQLPRHGRRTCCYGNDCSNMPLGHHLCHSN